MALRNVVMPDPTFFNIFSICLSHFSFSSNNTPKHSKVLVNSSKGFIIQHDRIIVDYNHKFSFCEIILQFVTGEPIADVC